MSNKQPPDEHTEARGPAAAQEAGQRRRSAPQQPGGRSLVRLWLAATLALVAAFSLSIGLAQAAAGANAITITSETQTYTYATRITFQMRASDSAGQITSARLEISVPQIGIDHQVSVSVAQPGSQVALTYRYDPSTDYLPPFTPITYHWALGDNAQHTLTGANQHFDFVDTRFAWQHLSQGKLSVYWYHQNTAYGQNILKTASQEAASIEKDLNGTITAPIRVLVYATSQDWRGGLPPNTPNWAGGVALIQLDEALIVVGDAQYPLQRDLPHELTHLIFHEIAGPGCGGCPLWFDEGMAVYHQSYHEPEMQFDFDDAVQQKKLLPFSSIADAFPQDPDQAELAYAQSWNFIKYFYSTFGQPKVAQLVDTMRASGFNSAFQKAFGQSVDQVENQWRVSLGLQPIAATPTATPTAGNTTSGSQNGSQPTASAPGNGSAALSAIGLGLVILLLAGLVGAVFIARRGRKVPAPATGAPWPLPPPGAPQPDYQPDAQTLHPAFAAPPGSAPADAAQWHIEQQQTLARRIDELMLAEKRLSIQRAEIERQIGFYAAQEQQARAARSEEQARLALENRQKLATHIPYLQQQLAQVRAQQQALEMERQAQPSARRVSQE